MEFCKRETIKVHDRAKRMKDKGSKDHGLIYVAFNGGMFLALKMNMMKYAETEFGVTLTQDPKIEMYGATEERMCLDLAVKMMGQEHSVKMKVYNTAAAMDFAGTGHPPEKRFDHLENRTVGEAFVDFILKKIVDHLAGRIDIERLNDAVSKMAVKGKSSLHKAKQSVCVKTGCKKELKKGSYIPCQYCMNICHVVCAKSNGLIKDQDFRCEKCVLYGKTPRGA